MGVVLTDGRKYYIHVEKKGVVLQQGEKPIDDQEEAEERLSDLMADVTKLGDTVRKKKFIRQF